MRTKCLADHMRCDIYIRSANSGFNIVQAMKTVCYTVKNTANSAHLMLPLTVNMPFCHHTLWDNPPETTHLASEEHTTPEY